MTLLLVFAGLLAIGDIWLAFQVLRIRKVSQILDRTEKAIERDFKRAQRYQMALQYRDGN